MKDNSFIVRWEDKKTVNVNYYNYTLLLQLLVILLALLKKDKTYFGGTRKIFKNPKHIEQCNVFIGSVDMSD